MFTQSVQFEKNATIIELRGIGTFKLVLTDAGRLLAYLSSNNDDILNCEWVYDGVVLTDYSVASFNATVLDGDNLIIMYQTKDGMSKVAIWPGDFPLYGNKDPYRLYYGIDTETLYMNIENRWTPVSYMDHGKLRNIGTLSHEELEHHIKVNGLNIDTNNANILRNTESIVALTGSVYTNSTDIAAISAKLQDALKRIEDLENK